MSKSANLSGGAIKSREEEIIAASLPLLHPHLLPSALYLVFVFVFLFGIVAIATSFVTTYCSLSRICICISLQHRCNCTSLLASYCCLSRISICISLQHRHPCCIFLFCIWALYLWLRILVSVLYWNLNFQTYPSKLPLFFPF